MLSHPMLRGPSFFSQAIAQIALHDLNEILTRET